MRATAVRRAVLRWAASCERPLPWRGERDPYRVLVSEVMLQQTQAARVAGAYGAFLARFPTVEALAAAPLAEVLRAWGGLGYNRRARHLWLAARAVVERGGFPRTVEGLGELPGVGPYTARAVACFAFGADAAVVDANVRRVLTRVHGLPPGAPVQHLADALLPRGHAAAWNQALIDLGATVCRPRGPRCEGCPLQRWCAWAAGRRAAAPPRGPGPRFQTTSRYARGRVVGALRGAPGGLDLGGLVRATGLSEERVRAAVAALEAEGIVAGAEGRVWLGDRPPGQGGGEGRVGYRARRRRPATSVTT